jgi:hypothetical protein
MAEEIAREEFSEEQVMPGRLRTSATTEEQAIAEANKFADDFNARNLILQEYVLARTQAGPVEFQNPELAEIQRAMTQRQETEYTPEEAASFQRLAVAPIPPQVDFGDDPGMAGMGMGGGLPSVRQVPFRPVPPRPDEERLREEFDEGMGVTDAGFDTALAQAKVAEEEQMAKSISDDLASFKIQPFRAYENTMFAVVAALSSALGAAAQSLTGVPNTAVKLINDAINKDVAAQKAQYNALKDKSQVQNNVYGQAMNSLNNAKAAERQARLGARKAYELRLDAIKKERRGAVELNAQIDMFNASNEAAMNKLKAGMAAKAAKGEKEGGYRETVKNYANQVLAVTKELKDADIGVFDVLGLKGASFDPALLDMLASEDNKDLLRRYHALESARGIVVNAVMRSSGDSGALGDREHDKFKKDIEKIVPKLGLLQGLSRNAKKAAIAHAYAAFTLINEMLSLDLNLAENHARAKEIAKEIGKIADKAPEQPTPRTGVPKTDTRDLPRGVGHPLGHSL